MKYLNTFDTMLDYLDVKDNLTLPSASLIEETKEVIYDPYDEHDYVEIAGKKWATMNVGANSITEGGLYFQWADALGYTKNQVGSGEGKKYFGWDDYKWTEDGGSTFTKYDGSDYTVLQLSDDAINAAWGGNWRMPTKEEFDALLSATTNEWVENYQGSGVNGRLFTDKTDSSKTLFFPACGYCGDGSVNGEGNYSSYWSSSLYSNGVSSAWELYFDDEDANISNDGRYIGYNIRAIMD